MRPKYINEIRPTMKVKTYYASKPITPQSRVHHLTNPHKFIKHDQATLNDTQRILKSAQRERGTLDGIVRFL